MTQKETGGPAFPRAATQYMNKSQEGMTLREYAAIKLRVPDSGTRWLDDMIREAKRDDFAGQALAGIVADERFENLAASAELDWDELTGQLAYGLADAMIAERNAI